MKHSRPKAGRSKRYGVTILFDLFGLRPPPRQVNEINDAKPELVESTRPADTAQPLSVLKRMPVPPRLPVTVVQNPCL